MAEKKKTKKALKKYLMGKEEEEKRGEGKRGIPPRGCGWSVCRTARQINDRAKYVDYGNTSPTCTLYNCTYVFFLLLSRSAQAVEKAAVMH
jgi:hypothetical protein